MAEQERADGPDGRGDRGGIDVTFAIEADGVQVTVNSSSSTRGR